MSDPVKGILSDDDFFWFLEVTLDAMVQIIADLGDEASNRKIDTPGANSPYAVVTHCLGVIEFWGGHGIAGRTVQRNRAGEFIATGSVAELLARVQVAREQLREDISEIQPALPPRGTLSPEDAAEPLGRTQGGVLMHIYEELSQHLGQMEVSRDVLNANWVRTV
jgi:hypothetical protein